MTCAKRIPQGYLEEANRRITSDVNHLCVAVIRKATIQQKLKAVTFHVVVHIIMDSIVLQHMDTHTAIHLV